jgi:polyribonucleotide nucleotidyltransferase
MAVINKTVDIGNGNVISIETGKLAKQADGAVMLTCGKTKILAAIVANKEASKDVDFLPLTVDYKEYFSASGKIPGGFLKREARPSDHEILSMRLVDRALRPLFPEDFHASTVMSLRLFSTDGETMPDSLVCFAASAAIAASDIPFDGPVSEARVGRLDGEWIINPTKTQMESCDVDLMVAATFDSIIMVEGEMAEISESEMMEAMRFGHEAIKKQCTLMREIKAEVGLADRIYDHEDADEDLYAAIKAFAFDKYVDIAGQGIDCKYKRGDLFGAIKTEFIENMGDDAAGKSFLLNLDFKKTQKAAVRKVVLEQGIRLDGRKTTDIRNIASEVDYLPATHGSALFTRGETQSLTSVTLGSKREEKMIDGAFISGYEKFMLHYNFPTFSTGEARPPRGTSRREIGHGNLAWRALKDMIPADSPYTIRVISDILESNGSSSMATVCAGSMAMMDAGIGFKKGVSGIAMGLITDEDGKFAVLSDILGDEDFLGDMDFKVAGTTDGITAVQMDIKVKGLSYEILTQALEQSKAGRAHILGEMEKVITVSNDDMKGHSPRITEIRIPEDMIGTVIGPGGKMIKEIQMVTGADLNVSEDADAKEGIVQIMSNDADSLAQAITWIEGICAKPEIGATYDAVVKKIAEFGAFVEFLPGQQGLVHISEISWDRTNDMKDTGIKEGDAMQVKITKFDDRKKKFVFSRKALLEKPAKD